MVVLNTLLLTVVAFISLGLASPADPQITAPARLEVRATSTSPYFIGFASAFGAYSPLSCGTASRWSTVANYGKCCSTQYNNCEFATACKSGSIVMYTTTSYTCTVSTAPACIVDWVVNDLSDQKTISWVGCDVSRAGSVYIRATTITDSSASMFSSSSTPAANTPGITSTTPSPGQTSPSSDPLHAPKKSHIAIIAGAAVGGLAILALLTGLLIWIILLNKKNKTNKANAAAGASGLGGANNSQYPPVQYQQQTMQQQQQPQFNSGYFSPEQQRMSMVPAASPPPVYPQEYKTPVVTSDAVAGNGAFGQGGYQGQEVSPMGYQVSQGQMGKVVAPPVSGAYEMPASK